MMRVVITSQLPEIRRVLDKVEEFRALHSFSERDANALSIVLDEILSNTIRHGLAEAPGHDITIVLDCHAGEVTVDIVDDGLPFDPTRAPEPRVEGGLAERKVGGLGISFVRKLTESMVYERVGGRNHLVLRRRLEVHGP